MLLPDRTRCSPGLRSPSGCSPLVQPAIKVPEQDPLQPGGDHRWCSREIADLTRNSLWHGPGLFAEYKSGLLQTCARLPDQHRRSDLPWVFRLLCTFPRANAQKDSQVDPSKTILIRLVAFLLYFGLPNLNGLRCCDRPSMSGHHAWLRVVEAPRFPARIQQLTVDLRLQASEEENEAESSAPKPAL